MAAVPIQVRNAFVREARAQLDIKPHVHHVTQWYHCVSGGMTVSIDGRLFGLRSGDSVLVPPGSQRALWRSGRPPTYFGVLFEDRQLALQPSYQRLLELPEDCIADRQALLRELTGIGGPDSVHLVDALVVRLLIGIRRAAQRAAGEAPRRRYTDSRDELARQALVRQVEAVMQRNLAQSLTREEVAAMVNVSGPHLARLYKQATGKTLHQRLTELRMGQAATLLRDSNLSVSQIAGEVGFGSFSHFTKTFRATFGSTPSAWRKAVYI